MGIKGPCKTCTKRVLHCHTNCADYKKYKDALDKQRSLKRKQSESHTVRDARTKYNSLTKLRHRR